MRFIILIAAFILSSTASGQKIAKDLYLKHSIRQDGLSYNFKVIDPDQRGVSRYNKDKFYYWFKTQKVLSTQGGASGALLHGTLEAFYESKQLAQKGEFRKGLKHGEWIYWRPDGTISRTENWKNGKPDGEQRLYNTQGKLTETIHHKRNSYTKRTGDSLIVSNQANTQKTVYTFDSTRNVKSKIYFKNGLQEGKAKYYQDGKLVQTENYKKGKKVVREEAVKEQPSGEKKKWFRFLKKDKEQAEPKTEKTRKKWFGKERTVSKKSEKKKKESGNAPKKENKFFSIFKSKKGTSR